MNELIYLVYDEDNLICGFVSLCAVVTFMEEYRANSEIPMYLVDASTGEVIDTWVNGAWENGDY